MNRAELAYALLRVTLGVLLLFAGIGKFLGGVGEFASGLVERFDDTWLPEGLVGLAGHVLPFVEVGLGGLLLLGLFAVPALVGTSVLILLLTFGTTVVQDHEATGRNVLYALAVFALLWLAEHDRYSVDGVREEARGVERRA